MAIAGILYGKTIPGLFFSRLNKERATRCQRAALRIQYFTAIFSRKQARKPEY
jgi:hypothetical protein